MPALKVCNRKWTISAEDLALPSCCGGTIRLIWSILTSVVLSSLHFALHNCGQGEKEGAHLELAIFYISLYLGVCVFCLAMYTSIFCTSVVGTIPDVRSRKKMPKLLIVFATLTLLQLPLNILGTYVAFGIRTSDLVPCNDGTDIKTAWIILRCVVVSCWVDLLIIFTLIWLTMSNPLNVHHRHNTMVDPEIGEAAIRTMEETGKIWESRCKTGCRCFQLATCNLFGGVGHAPNEAYRQIALVMAQFFKGLDLVPSDLVASLLLLRAEQRAFEDQAIAKIRNSSYVANEQRGAFDDTSKWLWQGKGVEYRARSRLHVQHVRDSRTAISSNCIGMDGDSAIDHGAIEMLQDASYYGSYMLGIYGWMLFTYMKPHNGICKLCCSLDHSSGCLDMDYAALRHNTGLRDEDILYTSFTSYCGKSVPYCIAVDHERKSVVIACRGTLSLADLITDVLMEPTPLYPHGDRWGFDDLLDADSSAHSGMLGVATWMREDIGRKRILSRLFGAEDEYGMQSTGSTNGEDLLEPLMNEGLLVSELPDCSGYDLVVLGHSLGAGVASILSLMLKPKYPWLRCIAFSPPGCVFDRKLADSSSSWISSIFVGKDMVVRASWHTLIKARGQMLEMIRRSKVNKNIILQSALFVLKTEDLLWDEREVPDTPYTRSLSKRIQEMAEGHHPLDRVKLYAPGKLLHLAKVETRHEKCCFLPESICHRKHQRFVPMWVDDRGCLDEFLLSDRMALDHFPDYVDKVIKAVTKEYCPVESSIIEV